MRTMTTATAIPPISGTSAARPSIVARFVGITIASFVPAIFWSVIIELASIWLGKPLSVEQIVLIGGGIAVFLFIICAPLMLRKQDSAENGEIEAQASKSTD